MPHIYVPAEDVWDYYEDNLHDLKKSMHKIAENTDYGVTVYLSDDTGFPDVIIDADGETVYQDFIASPKECEEMMTKIYENFLSAKAIETLANIDITCDDDGPEPEIPLFDLDDEIEEREIEIENALWVFLDTVLGNNAALEMVDTDETFTDIKEHFLEYLARKHGLPVHRPMFLADEDGVEFYEEYPYEYMIFDDEDE